MSGLEIIVVDDDPDFGEVLAEACAALGHAAGLAKGAAEGLDLLRGNAGIRLAIVDVKLADGESGFAFVNAARAARPGLHCVLLSGYGALADRPDGAETEEVYGKPMGLEELSKLLETHLSAGAG